MPIAIRTAAAPAPRLVIYMDRLYIGALALASGCSVCGGAAAQVSLVDRNTIVHVVPRTQFVSPYQYKAAKARIAAEFESAKAGCEDLRRYAREACVAKAWASERKATAELEVRLKRTLEAYWKALMLGTESRYSLAVQKCRGPTPSARNRCVNEVKLSFGMT